MSWTLLAGLVLLSGLFWIAVLARRHDLRAMAKNVAERERMVELGSDKAKLQHPVIDLSRCLGCGTCVAACPEKGVLEIVHGQAVVVNGARCVGVSACERECPTGAVTVTLSDLETRDDVPVVTDELEAVGSPGLFLAGEVTAHALIRTAVEHGTAVAREVAARVESDRADPAYVPGREYDLVIVGAGPAGLACSLEARRLGLTFVTLEQEHQPGGTVAKYPRRKLVLTEPVELPLIGRLNRRAYEKEELIDLWDRAARDAQLPIQCGQVFDGVDRDESGRFAVRTADSTWTARYVCLALGRRGVPTKLGVPGEELTKVAYDLVDAQSYQERRILVVGGGDSAVETAIGLCEQPGNEVTLSYRKDAFFRVRDKNEERLQGCLERGQLQVLFGSEVASIGSSSVELSVGGAERVALPNDDVFVMAGGVPPFDLLRRSGVSFDPKLRPAAEPIAEQGTGLARGLGAAFLLSVVALVWCLVHGDYYLLSPVERPAHPKHDLLRPGRGIGFGLGLAAVLMIVVNLLYLVRRAPRPLFPVYRFGSLQGWMTSHIATGVLACLCALVHASMSIDDSSGGHALIALFVLLVTGAIGRYFYAWVPRATNGRELELAEAKTQLAELARGGADQGRAWTERARREVLDLVQSGQWQSSFFGRAWSLAVGQRELGRLTSRLAAEGLAEGVDAKTVSRTLRVARRTHRIALMVAHYEDLRAVLSTWRYLHRWIAALLVLLVLIHVGYALAYGASS